MDSSKPKILVVSPVPPPMSGPEIMTQHLLNSSLNDGYDLVHFNISKNRDINAKAKFDFVNILFGLMQPFKLLWLMLRHKPDAVYTNMAQNLGGFLRYASFIWIVRLFGVPVVTRVMGDGFGHFYRNFKYKGLIRATLGCVSRVIVRADLLKEQFKGIVPDEKLKVVYSGIECEDFERTDLKVDRSNNDFVRVLFVGYLTQAKGAFDLLKVIPDLVAAESRLEFRLMGAKVKTERNIVYIDGVTRPQDEVLEELMTDDVVKERTEFLGVLSGDEKVREFVNADIYVLCSHSEAFPTSVLESMAAGLAVVATPVGVLPEAFDDRAIEFYDVGDLDGLKTAILKLSKNNELRKEMAEFNFSEARRNYTIDAYGNRVKCLFDDLLNRDNCE